MIVGACILPTAPLLLDGVSGARPSAVDRVADAVDAVVDSLPDADVAVLLASTPSSKERPEGQHHGLYDVDTADLAGIARPDIVVHGQIHRAAIEAISRVTQYPLYKREPLPLGLAMLALQLAGHAPVVPIAVPRGASADALIGVGAGIAGALRRLRGDDDDDEDPPANSPASDAQDEGSADIPLDLADTGKIPLPGRDLRVLVVAAGDLSAGLTEKSPLHAVDGARAWDDEVVRCVDSGRLDGIAGLGPEEAERVGAVGWAPVVVLHGCLARAKLGMVVRHYSAPRGVGYLVAQGG